MDSENKPFKDASRIFTGHRALGLVSNHVPLVTRYIKRRKENLIVTVIGKSFHTYGAKKLGLLSVGTPHSADISCLAADTYHVYTAVGKTIYAWRRGTELKHTYSGHEKPVIFMMTFGPHLVSVDEGSLVKVWDIKAEEVFLELPFTPENFAITSALHPVTYINKILFASKQGTIQLWNLRTAKQVYVFKGWDSPVTVLEQAPAVDVVAVGHASGDIILHNLKFDETVMKFRQEWGPITSLAFRTDGAPVMISGSPQGHLAIWNLENRTLLSQIRYAHRGAVTGLKSLPDEPLIITSSPDNTVKMWIFDQSDGGARLLRLREGHSAPPTYIRFHGSTGDSVLSAGLDSTLRSFSTVADILHRSLGKASFNRNKAKREGVANDTQKMPPIVSFASEAIRDKEWDSIAAVHRGMAAVTTWSFHKATMGQHRLAHPRFREDPLLRKAAAKCITVSACGNYVLIGYDSGHVDRFNIQSGLHRTAYVVLGETTAGGKEVRGVACDGFNQMVIAATANRKLYFWTFKTADLVAKVDLGEAPSFITIHRESGLLAVALEDFTVCVVEIDTKKIVRRLNGHTSRLTDLAFSPDGRWIVTSALDSTIRTWDLPSGTCVDCFLIPEACTSLTFSPTGEFLCTSHVDDLGVYLWSNKSVYSHISLRPIDVDYSPKLAPMPGTEVDESADDEQVLDESEDEFASPEQIADSLVTLSLLPDSRWKNLLHLDLIRRRNKPKEPPKVPKAAPFFLQTLSAVTGGDKPKPAGDSKILESSLSFVATPLSPWAEQLESATTEEDYVSVIFSLSSMGPSAIDTEIRSLGPESGGSDVLLEQFMKAVSAALDTRKNYELVQAYMALFLKIHAMTLAKNPRLCQIVEQVSGKQAKEWTSLQGKLESSLCLVGFFRNAVL